MKKLALIFIVLLSMGTLFAEGTGGLIGAGVFADYQMLMQGMSLSPMDESFTINSINFGVLVDATYAVLNVSYATSIGDPSGEIKVSGTKDQTQSDLLTAAMKGLVATYIDVQLLGKYPINLGSVTLAPAAGIDYMLNLGYTQNGTDLKASLSDTDKTKLNDIYIMVGAIADFNITQNMVIGLKALYGFNVTPDYPGLYPSGIIFSGSKIDAGLRFVYKF